MKRLVGSILMLGLFGCSPEQVLSVAPKSSVDEIAKAVCSITTNGHPIATGFFVSYCDNHFLVTAAHVIKKIGDEIPSVMVSKDEGRDCVEEQCFGKWVYPPNGADVCAMEVSAQVDSLIKNGGEFSCIDLEVDSKSHLMLTNSPNGLPGVGVLMRSEIGAAGIGRGSDAFALGTCTELWQGFVNQHEVPIVYRGGKIACIPKSKSYEGRDRPGMEKGVSMSLIATDIPVIGGMSGAPVFANDCSETPFLIGVMISKIPAYKEVVLLQDKGITVKKRDDGRLLIESSPYTYLENTLLSYIVPVDDIFLCVSRACPPSLLPLSSLLEK